MPSGERGGRWLLGVAPNPISVPTGLEWMTPSGSHPEAPRFLLQQGMGKELGWEKMLQSRAKPGVAKTLDLGTEYACLTSLYPKLPAFPLSVGQAVKARWGGGHLWAGTQLLG